MSLGGGLEPRTSGLQHQHPNAGVNVNPHPGTRCELVGKRRGFDRNRILERGGGLGNINLYLTVPRVNRGLGGDLL